MVIPRRLLRALCAATMALAMAAPYASALGCKGGACCLTESALAAGNNDEHHGDAPCHSSHESDASNHSQPHGESVGAYESPEACPMMDAIGATNVAPVLVLETAVPPMPVLSLRQSPIADTGPTRLPTQLTPPPRP
jgi:hypothetical protein